LKKKRSKTTIDNVGLYLFVDCIVAINDVYVVYLNRLKNKNDH
jgi:hypothetical protein